MKIACAFPTTLQTPEHVRIAENLGYATAWLYDTPQQSPDVWMMLALAAAKTHRIRLGPGVLVPSLRHPMVNAAATAALVSLAPGRVVVGFGTGFTGRRAMGYGSIPWAKVERYIEAFRALLRGETIEWEGSRMRMLHPDGSAPPRPIEVPLIVSAFGPKGMEVTQRLSCGIFAGHGGFPPKGMFDWVSCMSCGTLRAADEAPGGEREKAAIGAGWALQYHLAYEFAGADAVAKMPGGQAWLDVINAHPPDERHLAVHHMHLIAMNEADHAAWNAGGWVLADQATMTGTASEVRAKLKALEEAGVTEFCYQPMGEDIPGELERFIAAA